MKLGIIADTHDNLPMIRKAVEFFNQEKVNLVLHAGDWVAPFVFNEFEHLNCKIRGVFGNNDGEKFLLKKHCPEIYFSPYELQLEGRKILLLHAPAQITALAKSGDFDIIIYGHTHKPEIYVPEGTKTLIINPGECSGWLYNKPTVGILDLSTLEARIVKLDK